MIDHLTFYATDYDKTVAFYDAVLAPLGAERCVNMVAEWDPEWPTRKFCAWGIGGRAVFWLSEVKEAATPRHLAFSAESDEQVRAFYEAGLANGGSDNGAPGPRDIYHPGYYGAFVIDPDGNNVEAVIHTFKAPNDGS